MGPRRISRLNVAARAMNHDALAVPKTKQMTVGHDVARCCGRVSYEFQHEGRMRAGTVGCEVKIRARE